MLSKTPRAKGKRKVRGAAPLQSVVVSTAFSLQFLFFHYRKGRTREEVKSGFRKRNCILGEV